MIWAATLSVLTLCTLAASVRLATTTWLPEPRHRVLQILSAPAWCLSLLLFLPSAAGEFARQESSPLPWRAFTQEASQHGITNGSLAAVAALIADLWFLWIPAHLYTIAQADRDKRVNVLARLLNVCAGLLLVTPRSPINRLLDLF
jgi:hypothetical protein